VVLWAILYFNKYKKIIKIKDGIRIARASKSPHYVEAACATTYDGKKLPSLMFFKSSW
jgi:hypothetical protein